MEKFFVFWKDAVWSKVIAYAICAAAAWAFGVFLGWWPSGLVWVHAVLAFAAVKVLTPYWAFGVAFILVASGWLLYARRVLMASRERRIPFPHFNYRLDTFDGLHWRWKYNEDGALVDLAPHCPTCNYLVHADFKISPAAIFFTQYRCEGCGAQLPPTERKFEDYRQVVSRKIMARISKGEHAK